MQKIFRCREGCPRGMRMWDSNGLGKKHVRNALPFVFAHSMACLLR